MRWGKIVSLSLLFTLSFGVISAEGYGGGGSRRSGGGGGSLTGNICSDFDDIFPEKNHTFEILSEVSFVAPSGYDSDSIAISVNGENFSPKVQEKANGDLVVKANLPNPITQAGAVKISLSGNDNNKCEKNMIYFIKIDPNFTEKKEDTEKKEEKPRKILVFSDTQNHWAKDFVAKIVDRGIASGYGDGSFGPDKSIGRAEMVKMILNAAGKPSEKSTKAPFEDVPADSWEAPYVSEAKKLGIVYGYWGNRIFEPFSVGTRAAAIKMLVSAVGIDVSGYRGQSPFPDVPASMWYAPYIAWAKSNGIINGYANGNFGPNNPITRGEMAKMTISFLTRLGR